MDTNFRILLIGAGPIGLEMAVALKAVNANYIHIEAGQIGQTISWYPRQVRFFSSPDRVAIAGVPLQSADQSKATREEYLAYLRTVVQQFKLQINCFETVISLQHADNQFIARTRRGAVDCYYRADKVILALGDMHYPRLLHIPGEDLPHVSHYFQEPHQYFNQRLLVVGGHNSAVECALRCHHAGAHVTLSYRKPAFDPKVIKYWLLPELQWLIEKGDIRFLPETVPTHITRESVKLKHLPTEQITDIETDFVQLLTGYVMDTTLFTEAGVTLQGPNQAPTINPDTMETDVPGLFVVGTAAAGTQRDFRLFIENCHPHIVRVMRTLFNQDPLHINPLAFTRLNEHPGDESTQPLEQ